MHQPKELKKKNNQNNFWLIKIFGVDSKVAPLFQRSLADKVSNRQQKMRFNWGRELQNEVKKKLNEILNYFFQHSIFEQKIHDVKTDK